MSNLKALGNEIEEFVLSHTTIKEKFRYRLDGRHRVNCSFYVQAKGPRLYTYLEWQEEDGETGICYLGRFAGSEEDVQAVLQMSKEYREGYKREAKEKMLEVG